MDKEELLEFQVYNPTTGMMDLWQYSTVKKGKTQFDAFLILRNFAKAGR